MTLFAIGSIALALLIIIFGPQLWAKHIFKKYAVTIEELPGTGGQLAEHLIEYLRLDGVSVKEGEQDENYYDPEGKLVSLSADNFNGKSLTAVTIAAHEIGHAIQHQSSYQLFIIRTRLAKFSHYAEKMAAILLIAVPFISLITKNPAISALTFICGMVILVLPVLIHLCTLPVEWDASFQRALPLLIAGQYIHDSAIPVVKQILTAAALTYVAASLASLLNFYRWLVFLRR